MLLPAGDGNLARMTDTQSRRVAIVTDWFSDPEFFSGKDTVCLIAESRSLIHPRIGRLPQVLTVDVPAPGHGPTREHYLSWHRQQPEAESIPVPEDEAAQRPRRDCPEAARGPHWPDRPPACRSTRCGNCCWPRPTTGGR
ncbi:MAG: hypothetical protein KatS3mg111_0585 [Pirellulaceae bacterium]|nr:MAG: hypothetical protein KatS3mg111_0585 [Pirellulaceae bacterium]